MSVKVKIIRFITAASDDRRGNIALLTALALPVLIGFTGLAAEVNNWYMIQRAMQNATDSAAVAAATDASGNYIGEALAVASRYGYVNGIATVTVATSNTATCPSGSSSCYSVTINKSVPLFFSSVIGFSGNGNRAVSLSSVAIAERILMPREYCIMALRDVDVSDDGFLMNGAPNAYLSGCNVMTNESATCNGNMGSQPDVVDAHGVNTGCGTVQNSHVDEVSDPYSGLASHIPADSCPSYPQEPVHHDDAALPASNLWTGAKALNGDVSVCGDLKLSGDVTVNAPAGAVLVIRNGQLDTNGHALRTADGSALTVVFAGTDGSYTHAPTGGGALDIAAPTTGNWKGVAIYQAPNLTTGVDISAAGNSPTWNISGLTYFPHASVTFSGAVNKSSHGASCFAMVVGTLRINGQGSILAHGGCADAGLDMPSGNTPGRGMLVN